MSELDEILAEAIRQEREAHRLYESLSADVQDASAKALLQALADDEKRHEERLSELSADDFIHQKIPSVGDLRISDFLASQELSPDASFQQVLIFAAKKEDSSWKGYQTLADQSKDPPTKQLFEHLAAEEKSHKNRLEKLYDDVIYRED